MHVGEDDEVTGIREGSTPDRVLGILEADGGWMNAAQLGAELESRFVHHPATKTLDRALWRLAAQGFLESRLYETVRYKPRKPLDGPWAWWGRSDEFATWTDVAEWRVA